MKKRRKTMALQKKSMSTTSNDRSRSVGVKNLAVQILAQLPDRRADKIEVLKTTKKLVLSIYEKDTN